MFMSAPIGAQVVQYSEPVHARNLGSVRIHTQLLRINLKRGLSETVRVHSTVRYIERSACGSQPKYCSATFQREGHSQNIIQQPGKFAHLREWPSVVNLVAGEVCTHFREWTSVVDSTVRYIEQSARRPQPAALNNVPAKQSCIQLTNSSYDCEYHSGVPRSLQPGEFAAQPSRRCSVDFCEH